MPSSYSTTSKIFFAVLAIGIGTLACAALIRGGAFAYKTVFSPSGVATVSQYKIDEFATTSANLPSIGKSGDKNTELVSELNALKKRGGDKEVIRKSQVVLSNAGLSVTAFAYAAIDLDSGTTLVSRNASLQFPPASLTKLVTAVVAEDVFLKDDMLNVTQAALNTEGSTAKLRLGEKIKAGDMLYPLLMVSSNDAAEVFARSYGRSKFVAAMNKKVLAMGVKDTYFEDPSGLAPQNLSTANDLASIAQWIYKYRQSVFDITRIKMKSVGRHTWVNPTHFLNLREYLGGKNGFTDEAEKTAVSLFSITTKSGAKRRVVVVTLQSEDRDNDTLKIVKYLEKNL